MHPTPEDPPTAHGQRRHADRSPPRSCPPPRASSHAGRRCRRASQLLALLGVAALAVVLVALWAGARDGDWRVLFPNLSEKDGGQVIDRLTQLNVPYRFADGGGTLLVPAARVHELRMKLAAAGLPSGAPAPAAPATNCWTRTASARPRARNA